MKRVRFIAVDGESITHPVTGKHEYVQLCSSTGDYIEDPNGLSTVKCLEFLLDLKRNNPKHELVGFAFNYDVNMILRDVPREQLEMLWKDRNGTIILDGFMYDLKWIPTKFVEIQGDIRASVSDVFGFFQTSFLTALKDWNVPDIDGALERIESGKADRGNFTVDDMPEMRRYCLTECLMLVELCEKLQDSLIDAGLQVKSWIGAGAVGQAMLKQYDVLDHHVHDYTYPKKLQEAIMYGYFGGRFEMYRQGHFEQAYNYDIISAYPYECLSLPSLIGSWEEKKTYDPTDPFAIWLVEWQLDTRKLVMPFPYRYKDGNIYYPPQGRGWYWGNEVREALAMHPEIRVLRGYVFHPLTDAKPFNFLTDVWAKRKEAKEKGLASQKAYKLGMNSLYGKLAQGKGYQGRVPKQRSFVWAGMICSNTRARLLSLMNDNEDKIIAVATDGLFFSEDPGFTTGNELGELELNAIEDFYQFLNGVYYSPNAKIRTRGHSPKELDWQDIVNSWTNSRIDAIYRYSARRFIGLGQALLRKDFSVWRTWEETTRELNLHQWLRKFIGDELSYPELPEQEVYEWYSGELDGIAFGKPYKPKTDVMSQQTEADKQAVLEYLEMVEQPTLMIEG